MHSAATLLLMMGLMAPISCEMTRSRRDDYGDIPDHIIGPSGEIIFRPDRPKNFNSADELKFYLDNIRAFYAMAGRPRFGKRGPPILAFQRQTVAAEKSRKVHQLSFPEDDYGDPVAPQPFRRPPFLVHRNED